MLSVSKPIKAGQGEYYLSLAGAEDYYLEGDEPPGFWLGGGAAELNLTGELQPEHFRNLLRGFSPEGERKLVKNADSERRAGWDLTWSVPKSVSVAWSQADSELRSRIEACVRQAVGQGIAYLEESAAVTRRGIDGHIREKARLTFAAFQHSTSRAQDPQLHVHTVLLNVAVRADGTTGTVEPREIYRHQMAAGALFRAELAALLEWELGLRARREGRAFELLGVDEELIRTFSRRRAAIDEALNQRGLHGGKAAEIAALDTRVKKESVSREELFARWQETGREHGWTGKDLSFLLHAPWPPRDPEREAREMAEAGISRLTQSKSHFSVRELTQTLSEEAQDRNIGANEIGNTRQALLSSPELVYLGLHRGEQHWTTQEVLRIEKQLLQSCDALHKRESSFPTALAIIDESIQRRSELSDEQRAALYHVCQATGGIRVVSGMAGTGKSTLFAAACEVWEAEGLTVLGGALSGKAARGLQESTGIGSQTLHRTLYDLERGALKFNESTVLVVDEAAMVGTRQLAAISAECVRAGATLVLVGDARQLQAIELGGAFAEIARRYGAAELVEIRRQREEWARDAVKDFAAGEAKSALLAYKERGLLAEAEEGRWGAMERLIADWSQEAPSRDKDTVLLAGTNADVTALNRMAQKARHSAGILGAGEGAVGKEHFFEGDRVILTRNSMTLSVMNGDRGTVEKIVEGKTFTVRLDSGALVQIDTQAYDHLRLGYAMTTHMAQGMTAGKAFILVSDQMVDREMAYVQASRARGETRWYIGDELDEVSRGMAHSRQKEMALSLAGPGLELTIQR